MINKSLYIPLYLVVISSLFTISCCIPESDTFQEDDCFIDSGTASWYGEYFHGKLTASGERYDTETLTAAHKTLPFNTIVRVVNVENEKSVEVRINNRGPFTGDRIIDLSRKAAQKINIIDDGLAEVELYLVKEGERPIQDLECE
ncbi:septal ring lytic transglycosylase RlpA family protein [Aliifodinibius salicampi]|uniref:Probable endolytic peptidoglycan transglycosylase RlpA n=1 Tax=Fodinibius salicampi TaxID=1920655 RepID=A0ABT3PWC3_9BACT|nr:septal ring lytic transglycosylase RlpA family protein [Fodinibius salicampi]MCW9712155.1 septal ring lytic transglycosylase RlpA family protein [Fodinibius salicampi]